MARVWQMCIAAILMAGCAADPAPAVDETGPTGPNEAIVSETTGAIQGIVVDAAFAPIANATVGLLAVSAGDQPILTTTSDEGGRFVFSLVAPNQYRVEARASGYATTSRFVQVTDGDVSEIQLTLGDEGTTEPYIALLPKVGLINCGFAIVVWAPFCGGDTLSPVVGKNNAILNFSIPAGHQAIVLETDWTQRDQTMHHWIYLDTSTKWLGDAMGRPVLRKEFFPGVKPSSFRTVATNHVPIPASDTPFRLEVWTFYDGANQQTFNQTGGPACQYAIQGYCAGVGIAIQFRFNHYVSVFVHEAPPEVSRYSAVPDR